MATPCNNTETKIRWYKESKIAVKEMKKAREKWLMKGRIVNEKQEYRHKSKEAHKITRNKKIYTLKL
jgi:hypothetical protein